MQPSVEIKNEPDESHASSMALSVASAQLVAAAASNSGVRTQRPVGSTGARYGVPVTETHSTSAAKGVVVAVLEADVVPVVVSVKEAVVLPLVVTELATVVVTDVVADEVPVDV